MDNEKRSNIGYEIIDSRKIGNTEIVIGHNAAAPNPYVCWYCKGGKDYFWGHYTNELESAQDKMRERSEYEARVYREKHKPPKSHNDHER